MAEQNPEQSRSGQSGQRAHPAAAPARLVSSDAPKSASDNGGAETIGSRKGQYLIGSRPVPGLASVPIDLIVQKLGEMEEVEIVKRIRPRRSEGSAGAEAQLTSEILVVRMDERRSEALRQGAAPNVVIEPDGLLHYAEGASSGTVETSGWNGTIPLPFRGRDIAFRVIGDGDRPLADASVIVFGSALPAQAVTDASGQATVTFYDEHNEGAGSLDAVRAVYVRPAADHWERFVPAPALRDGVNLVRLRPLSQTFPNFPDQRLVGWGHRLMKLDLVGDGLDAAGVKVGLIGSGCDHTHPLLRHVTQGVEIVDPARPTGWTIDPAGHGTHCAGIIAAGDRSRPQGVLGFAPGAELHVLKVLPGGRFSDLIAALDECIERQLDIAHIAVRGEQTSELVALKLAEARRKGVACIVAGGSTRALFAPTAAGALAVSGVGKIGEYPPDTLHAQTATGQPVGAEGLFFPRFGAHPLQAEVYAPGVAVISTVPGGGYAARDGVSAAAAHIAGLAAILIAHHPLFHGLYRMRGEDRVAALFETIRVSGDPSRTGSALLNLQGFPGRVAPASRTAGAEELARSTLAAAGDGRPFPPYLAPNPVLTQLRAMGMI
jgi:subtilisin